MWGKLILVISFAITFTAGLLIGSACRGIFFEEKPAAAVISKPLPAEPSAGQEKEVELPIEEVVKREIHTQSLNYEVNSYLAFEIAKCESRLNPLAKNPHSTAKGVYQFINRTWADYCDGDVYNYEDNIRCFMRWFNKYPSWWSECLNKN